MSWKVIHFINSDGITNFVLNWTNVLGVKINNNNFSKPIESMEIDGFKFQNNSEEGNFYHYFRTDNSIKNHFYSTIRRSMRRICKLLGNRNSTSKLRDIRPSVLSEIFEFSKNQQMKSLNNGQNDDIATCLLTYAK